MPLRAAHKKAPDAVYVPLDMELYEEASKEVFDSVRALGLPLEVWGWDEGYVGFGLHDEPAPSAEEALAVADRIGAQISSVAGLESCIGISDNKQRAKIAAGFAKKAVRESFRRAARPEEQARRPGEPVDAPLLELVERTFVLTDDNWFALVGERPCDALWSVGKKTAAKLADHGIDTVAQLASSPLDDLTAIFGPHSGNWLYVLARGGGDDTITTDPPPAKSHSRSKTYERDLNVWPELQAAAHQLLREVLDQVIGEHRMPVRVGVTVRTSTFFTRNKIRKLAAPTTEFDVIAPVVDDLLEALLEPAAGAPAEASPDRSSSAVGRSVSLSKGTRPVRLIAVRLELADPPAE